MSDVNLPNAISAQLEAAKLNYKPQLVFDVEYNGATYQADPESYEAMLAAAAQPVLPTDFYWLDKANNRVPFTSQQIKELTALVFNRRLALFTELQDRKARYRAATTVPELFP